MPKTTMAHIAGTALTLLLAGTTVLGAQSVKPRVPSSAGAPAGTAAGPTTVALSPSVLLPCCVLEGVESSLKEGTYLVVKNTGTGQRQRVRVAGAGGHSGSAASSTKYRPGSG